MMGSRRTSPIVRGPVRRHWVVALASIGLLAVLGTLAFAIAASQQQARSHVISTYALRGTSSATFVSTFIAQQATREEETAEQFLSVRPVSTERFRLAVAALGSGAAMLLDSHGRVLDVVPSDRSLLGRSIADRYAHLGAALRGRVAVSNMVRSAARGLPVAEVAVPFSTPYGRRVFSVAYRGAGSALGAFVDHAVPYRQHEVFLIDARGRLIAASPATGARTVAEADPLLARAAAHAASGSVAGARTPSTFTASPVAGTPWRLLISVPDSRVYLSIAGAARVVPWVVFALVSILGSLLVALLVRSHADRVRLAALSRTLAKTARTDSLTGLLNRRALTEELTRAAAQARRRGERLSVLMIDLDRFKETNDRFGHEAGDRVLCVLADCMHDVLRAEDSFGRWGGDEFLVVLWATDEADARQVGERLRAAAAETDLSGIGLEAGVPMSVGAATALADMTPDEIVRAADLDLYRAKRGSSPATAV